MIQSVWKNLTGLQKAAEHLWCDFKWAKDSSPNTNDLSHFRHFQNNCNKDENTISIMVQSLFWSKEGAVPILVYMYHYHDMKSLISFFLSYLTACKLDVVFFWPPGCQHSFSKTVPSVLEEAIAWVKETVHPKMKILSSFTQPQVFPNLYECVCSAEHKGRYSEEFGKPSSIFCPTVEVNGAPKLFWTQRKIFWRKFVFRLFLLARLHLWKHKLRLFLK